MFFKRLKRENAKKSENFMSRDGKGAKKTREKRVLNL